MITQQNILLEELQEGRREIKTDSLNMSIGEIINLYKDGDLELSPAYQRLFRWDDIQKSRFIESILLGIPLPPIFVAQEENAKWTVVDGLQRLSTILQLTNELKNTSINNKDLVLRNTKKIPSLSGLRWNDIPLDVQRILKRSKITINIILTENSISAQYELFQRLNTGGSHLEPQEIRNCLIIMKDSTFFEELEKLKEYSPFVDSISITENKRKVEYHMELILKYLIAKLGYIDFSKYNPSTTIMSDFIDSETINILDNPHFNKENEINIFKRTFTLLYNVLGTNSFKKFNIDKNEFEGPFLSSSFDSITCGIASNIDYWESQPNSIIISKIQNLYSESEYLKNSERGNKFISRFDGLVQLSKRYFSNEN